MSADGFVNELIDTLDVLVSSELLPPSPMMLALRKKLKLKIQKKKIILKHSEKKR